MAGTYLPLPVLLVRNRFETARRIVNKNVDNISEVDLARLFAYQLQVTYGKYQPTREIPELRHKPAAFRRRREEEWKALGTLSRQRAMERYLELLSQLLPQWDKDLDFTDLEISPSGSMPDSQLASLDLSKEPFHDIGAQMSIVKPQSRAVHTTRVNVVSLPQSRSKGAIEELQLYEMKRVVTSLPKLSRISAGYDAAETIRKIQMRSMSPGEEGKRPVESKYYRKMRKDEPVGDPPADQVKAVLGGFLETLQSGVNFGGENALWSDKASDALNRLETNFASLAKAVSVPALPSLTTPAGMVTSMFKPKFTAVEATLSECEKLMSESSEPCAAHIRHIKHHFSSSVSTLLDYIDEINEERSRKVSELEELKEVHEEEHRILYWLRDLYYANDPSYGLGNLRAEKRSQTELMLAEAYRNLESKAARRGSDLPHDCSKRLKDMEDNLRVATGLINELHTKLVITGNERDKLQDEIAMVQMSAYQENILLSNMFKDLKKSVGIIQGSEGRGIPNEVQLKKELDELKSENLIIRKDNEGLRERLRDARRRNSVAMDET